VLCFITITGFSQMRKIDQETEVTNVTKITLLNPGLSYEAKVGRSQTIYTQAFLNLSGVYDDYAGATFYIDPALTLQYRYYYNGKKRQEREKRTEMNSMNYLAPVYEVIFTRAALFSGYVEETSRRSVHRLGAVWGIQRNYKSRFSLDLNLGLGYMFGKSTTYDYWGTGNYISETAGQVTFMGQINIGFWLNKRKD
jgi:hypothetical protein